MGTDKDVLDNVDLYAQGGWVGGSDHENARRIGALSREVIRLRAVLAERTHELYDYRDRYIDAIREARA